MMWNLVKDKLPSKDGQYLVLSNSNKLSVREFSTESKKFTLSNIYAWAEIEISDVPFQEEKEHEKYWYIHKRKVERCLALLEEYETSGLTQKKLAEKYNRNVTAIADDLWHGKCYREDLHCKTCIHGEIFWRDENKTPYPRYDCKLHHIKSIECKFYTQKKENDTPGNQSGTDHRGCRGEI